MLGEIVDKAPRTASQPTTDHQEIEPFDENIVNTINVLLALCTLHLLTETLKDVTVLDGSWDLYHLDDVLASQYQSSDWTQHTTYSLVLVTTFTRRELSRHPWH